MEAMIQALARALVDHPEHVRVERQDGRGAAVVQLRVADEDLGQVIGRGGRIARSLRVLLRASAAAEGRRAVLEIVD